MSKCTYESIVSPSEAEALKEMIFKRARERAKALTKDVDTTFTSSIRNDVMSMARDSFVSNKNPFAQQVEKEEVVEEPVKQEETSKDFIVDAKVEAAKLRIKNIKSQIAQNNCSVREEIYNSTIQDAMHDARKSFEKTKTFIEALNFLNSKASLALVENTAARFEAVA